MKKIIRNSKNILRFCSEKKGSHNILMSKEEVQKGIQESDKIPIFHSSNLLNPDYFQKKGKYFDIENPSLDSSKYKNIIGGYSDMKIQINELFYPSSAIVFENNIVLWSLEKFNYHSPEYFSILEVIHPKPQYIIIGTDSEYPFLNKETEDYLKKFGLKFDVLDMFLAVSTFNSCMLDDIKVVAFLATK